MGPAHKPGPEAGGEALVPRWVPWLFAFFSLTLIPGIVRVFASTPPLHLAQHWRLAWGGFDIGLACALMATGVTLSAGPHWQRCWRR